MMWNYPTRKARMKGMEDKHLPRASDETVADKL